MPLESLEELRVFAQIVESGSMSRAARALGMPANTVSRRLASLEERLEVRLLHRTTRSISISEAGRTLLARAHRILREAEAAEADVRRGREGLSGMVRVAVPSVLTHDLLAALRPLMRSHPNLRVQIHIHDKPVNPVALGLDMAITGGRLADSTLGARKLGEIRLVPVASTTYLNEHGRPQAPADLADHPILCFLTDPPLTSLTLLDITGTPHTVRVPPRLEASDGRTVMDAIVLGMGVGVTSPRMLRSMPGVQRVLPSHTTRGFPLYAVFPEARQHNARVQAIIDAVRTVTQE